MASSEVSICSNALLQLGDNPIASFATSEGKRATLCANLWPQVRDWLLRIHTWPCARKQVVLAPDAATPVMDWGYQFTLPGDWLRTVQVGQRGDGRRYELIGRKILADTTALHLVYVWANKDPAQWDSLLCDLACMEMAARLAYPITQSTSLAQLKRQEADRALNVAKSIAGQDNEPEDYGDSPFTQVGTDVPKLDLLSTNFSAGEISPRLYGRPDIAKYADALKRARDVVIQQHGGARGRPGTEYLGEVKESSKATRIIPFVRDQATAYVLELGDGYARFWRNGALIAGPYEVTTPYTTATVFDMDYAQGADTMFLTLGSVPIYRLQRFADNRWALQPAPFDPVPFDEIGRRQATAITLGSAALGATTATAAAAAFLGADVGRSITYNGGVADITAFTSTTQVNATVTAPFPGTALPASGWRMTGSPQTTCTPGAKDPVGATTTLALLDDGWRATDVGSYVRINGGLLRITGYTSALLVDARIESALASTVAAEADAWSLESAVWNADDGYPTTVTLHQQRLVAGGTALKPQTIWGSRAGLPLDFTKGALDDDSYSFELASDDVNPIRYLVSGLELMVLTYGGEWTMTGGVEKPITPTNIRAIPRAKAGCAGTRPEQVDDDQFYSQRGVSVLRTFGYSLEVQGYKSGEASTFSEHLAKGGIEGLSFQQSPERVLWVQKADGKYLAVTVSKEQDIKAFTLCTPASGGVVESMATIPENESDATYMIVRRTINGVTKRYVERMNWDITLDCSVTKTPASATITGLGYLAGKTVGVLADGVDLGDFEVSVGGVVTLPRVAQVAVVGLRFVPTMVMLPPEFGTGMGAVASKKVLNGKTAVLFHETVGCNINGQPLAFRQFGEDVLDSAVQPFSGWKDITDLGWATDSGEIEITQPQAYPFCVLAVVRRATGNSG